MRINLHASIVRIRRKRSSGTSGRIAFIMRKTLIMGSDWFKEKLKA
jgi:hypothetical protein